MQRVIVAMRRNAIALLALFVALGGTGYAATKLPKNSVGAGQLKPNAVRSSDVKNRSLLSKDFKRGQLPRGATGPQGPAGVAGAAGTARAFVYVNDATCTGTPGNCTVAKAKGVTQVRRVQTGVYCISVPGATPATTPAVASPDYTQSPGPESRNSAQPMTNGSAACPRGTADFAVRTQRLDAIAARNEADTGPVSVLGNGDTEDNSIAFNLIVP